jgi:hypothetical protein
MGKSLLKALALLVLVPLGAYLLQFIGSGLWLVLAEHKPLRWEGIGPDRLPFILKMGAGLSLVSLLLVVGMRSIRVPYVLVFVFATLLIAVCLDRLLAAALHQAESTTPWSPVPDIKTTGVLCGLSAPFCLSATLFHWLIYRSWTQRAE